ncbi:MULTISPECIES: TMF family protein [unclassified Variovorax]|uniref:TMF family protein n=1 Tax=unclassified Variovorax TaxID=663243 RepID=UPI003F482443
MTNTPALPSASIPDAFLHGMAEAPKVVAYLVTGLRDDKPGLCFEDERGDYGDEDHTPVFHPLCKVSDATAVDKESLRTAALPPHPEPHSHTWTEAEKRSILAWGAAKDAEIQALRAQYEARELEAHQLSETIIKLRSVIRDHNADCEARCEQKQQSGDAHCPYAKYGRQCPDCPRDGMLDAAVSATGEGGQS